MNIDFKKELLNLKELDQIKEMMSEVYSQVLEIDKKKALEIVSAKFNRHIDTIHNKFEKGVTEENVKNIKSSKDVDLDEYLKDKPIIKG